MIVGKLSFMYFMLEAIQYKYESTVYIQGEN